MNIKITINNITSEDLDEELFDAIIDATDEQDTRQAYDLFNALEMRSKMMKDALWHDLNREHSHADQFGRPIECTE